MSSPETLKIAVLASGRGSNLQSILDAIETGKLRNAAVVLVLSNNSDAGALEIARTCNIPAMDISRKQYSTDEDFNKAFLIALQDHGTNFIVLAGYMKKLDSSIIKQFRNRIVNIHPALLPDFGGKGMYGIHVHEAVIASGATKSGATVHIVDEEYDRGPVVLQRTIDVLPTDTPQTLASRVLKVEHELYPEALALFAEGRIHTDGRNVTISIPA